MRNVLVVHYSQSGQLDRVAKNFCQPLVGSPDINVQFENVCPKTPFPFPWPFFRFIDTFPEAVYHDAPELQASTLKGNEDFDLIIIAYQVWFLSPSLPITGFMQTEVARNLLKDKPVVTLIACRNMWLMAQEDMKKMLGNVGARLVGNVALVDEAGRIGSFVATPMWVLSGNKGPRWKGLIPKAGVAEQKIVACKRFGERIRQQLLTEQAVSGDLLQGLSAVEVDEGLIGSEKTAKRAFKLWGKLFRAVGPHGSIQRKPLVCVYAVFLVALIITVVPLGILLKKLIAPYSKEKTAKQKAYYSQPSGQ